MSELGSFVLQYRDHIGLQRNPSGVLRDVVRCGFCGELGIRWLDGAWDQHACFEHGKLARIRPWKINQDEKAEDCRLARELGSQFWMFEKNEPCTPSMEFGSRDEERSKLLRWLVNAPNYSCRCMVEDSACSACDELRAWGEAFPKIWIVLNGSVTA